MTMPDNRQLSVTCKQDVGQAVAIRSESLSHCPVAQRMLEHVGGEDGFPTAAVAVVANAAGVARTAAESVGSGLTTVKLFARHFDERTLSAVILTHLTMTEDMLNVSRPMKPDALASLAKQVARMLLDDDMSWNFADIQIVMDRIADGESGQVFGGLTAPIVKKAFADYMSEKGEAYAAWREEESKRYSDRFGSERSCTTAKAVERVKHEAARQAYISGMLNQQIDESESNRQ